MGRKEKKTEPKKKKAVTRKENEGARGKESRKREKKLLNLKSKRTKKIKVDNDDTSDNNSVTLCKNVENE